MTGLFRDTATAAAVAASDICVLPKGAQVTASCAVEVTDGQCVVSLTGEVDLHNAEVIVQWLRLAVDVPGCRRVEVDLSSLDFLDAQGISGLLNGHRYAQTRGVDFRIKQPKSIVARALSITGADRILGLC